MNQLTTILLLLSINILAQSPAFDPIKSDKELYEFAEYARSGRNFNEFNQSYIDENLNFEQLVSENHSVGFTTDNYWVRFSLINSAKEPQLFYLETARPITDLAELYHIDDQGIKHFISGDKLEFSLRQVAHRATVFKIILKNPGEHRFYLHFKSDGETLNLPLNLYSESEFWQMNYIQQLFMGFFYGLILLAGIIYLFFYFSLNNSAFFYYSFYVFSIGLLQAALDGFLFQYIFQDGGFLNSRTVLVTALLSNFFLLKYCERFLEVQRRNQIVYKSYKVIYGIIAILMLMVFMSEQTLALAYPISNLNGLLSLLLILTTIVVLKFKKVRIDPFFSIGIFFLVIGLLGFVLNNLSLVPNNFYTLNSAKFGAGFEVIFLSLSMTNLIKKLRQDNEKSQRDALNKSLEINELKTYLMSNISHELRTPINAILNLSDLRINDKTNIEERENYEIIRNASVSLLSNVNDILDFEKIEKDELIIKEHEFNPLSQIVQISDNWKNIAISKGLTYDFILENKLPNLALGDAERLTQIINNVLSNAVKFTEKGGITLTVSSNSEDDISKIKIVISDTGIGIEEEIKSHVFDSFNQMRLNHSRNFGGIGLGLNIVQHLVKLFHGKIELESTKDFGTNVYIELKLKIAKTKLNPGRSSLQTELYPEQSIKILVVEDNMLNQLVIKKILSNYNNIDFTLSSNGKEALKALKEKKFNLILMDLQMPVMDGYEATEHIRSGKAGSANSNIPIIAVTADATDETMKRVLDIGMNDYMSKPINSALLLQKIENHRRGILKIA